MNIHLQACRTVYKEQSLYFWLGFGVGYVPMALFIAGFALLFTIFGEPISITELIAALVTPVGPALFGAVVSTGLAHSMRTMAPNSGWRWVWLSGIISQVGCIAAAQCYFRLNLASSPLSWLDLEKIMTCVGLCFPFALQYWGVAVSVIAACKLTHVHLLALKPCPEISG